LYYKRKYYFSGKNMYCNYKHNKNKVSPEMEDKKNFTFVMSGEQRDAITILSEVEDRSLSKIAEYLIWSGFERYIEQRGLPSPLAIRALEKSYRNMRWKLLLLKREAISLNY
jgi:hypothetical protein